MTDINPSSHPDDRIREISKRNVIYVSLDEEITSVFERIQQLTYCDVFLLVPQRAALLQSIINLSILKHKTADLEKKLYLITDDPVGKKLAFKADIPVFDEIKLSRSPKTKSISKEIDSANEPLTALGNEIQETPPERLSEKKISIFDVVQSFKGRRLSFFNRIRSFLDSRKEKELFKMPAKFAIGAPSGKTLGTLIVASLSILFVISYIALPGSTITIVPQSNVIEQSLNITLADANRYGTTPSLEGSYSLAYYPVEVTVEESLDYTATGQIFDGTNASGLATFINERTTPWPLVAFTRIQTEGGLIFRTQEPITIPAAQSNTFGTIDTTVVADETDAYGRVIGERGNIEPTDFFLPGLRETSREMLYARSSTPMSGGATVVTLKITQEDLDASKQLMTQKLESEAIHALEAEIEARNALNQTHLAILTGSRAITLSEPQIEVPTTLLEALQDQFQVTGRLQISGIAFDWDEFISILSQELQNRKSPDKILMKVDTDSISYEIFAVNEIPGQIKLTATIKGIEAYAIDPADEHGARLIKKIKEHVSGKTIQEAEDYVQNLPEVNKVNISSWPVWAPTIPTIFENIEVEVDKEWLQSMQE